MKYAKYLCMIVIVVLTCSCGITTRSTSYTPDRTQLHIMMNDLVYLGEVEIEASYSTYLFGLMYNIHTINGVDYDSSNKNITKLETNLLGDLDKLNKATYKVIEQFPEARYFQIVRRTKVKDRMFLGNNVKETAVIRAYKFNVHNRQSW